MKNSTIKAILIILICVTILLVVANFIIRKMSNDYLLKKLVPFLLEQEGGLSNDPDDNASAHPAPWTYEGETGWHTNKGITYQTFVSNAHKVGYKPTAENFFTMPDYIWLGILKKSYMGAFPLDEISHLPKIQAVIITWAWGSGPGGAEGYLANFQRKNFGIQDKDITPSEIVRNFKIHVNPLNEEKWFQKLCDQRAIDFSKMKDYPKYKNGWISRLNKFRKLFK